MKAIIEVDVPDYQIGQEVSIHFKDTMMIKGVVKEPKTGHWINITKQNLNDYRTGNRLCFECDQCHSQFTYSSNFCPNCGCRMFEPQESEDME